MCNDFVIHRISNIVCIQFNKLFLGPAKRSQQSSIYSPTSMDYSWGGGEGGGGVSESWVWTLVQFCWNYFLSDESIK